MYETFTRSYSLVMAGLENEVKGKMGDVCGEPHIRKKRDYSHLNLLRDLDGNSNGDGYRSVDVNFRGGGVD